MTPDRPGPALRLQSTMVWLIAVLLLAGCALRSSHIEGIRSRTPDERTYTSQANIIANEGFQGVRRMIAEHGATPGQWIYPPPTRIGYLWAVAAMMRLTSVRDERAGAWLSCVFSVLSLALLAWAGLRFFNPWIAVVALLLAVACVPDLVLARRAWQDSAMEFLGLLMLYLACEALESERPMRWCVAFAAAGAYSMLVKDSAPVVFGFWLLWLMAALAIKQKSWRVPIRLIGAAIAASAVAVVILIATAGGVEPLWQIYIHTGSAIPANAYAVEYQSGPSWRFVMAIFLLSPVATVLFLVGAVVMLLPATRKLRDPGWMILAGLTLFPAVLLLFSLVVPYFQNVRYLSPAYGAVYLIAAYGLSRAWEPVRRCPDASGFQLASALLLAALVIGAIRDYQQFEQLYVVDGVADLSVKMIADSTRF